MFQPEYNIEVTNTYHFSHSQATDSVENKMAENARLGGDFDQNSRPKNFFGAADYRTLGRGDRAEGKKKTESAFAVGGSRRKRIQEEEERAREIR